jgi:hypothetical protein
MTQDPQLQTACTDEDIALARTRLERVLLDPTARAVDRIRASRLLAELRERGTLPDKVENDSHGSTAF